MRATRAERIVAIGVGLCAVAGLGAVVRHQPTESRSALDVLREEASASPTTTSAPEPSPDPASPTPDPSPAESVPPSDAAPSPSPRTPYLPPDLRVQITARPARVKVGELVTFAVHVTDSDGYQGGRDYDYGDGTSTRFSGPLAHCSGLPEPYRPDYRGAPLDSSFEDSRGFRTAGTFTVRLTVRTTGFCDTELPSETVTATAAVTVLDGPHVSNGPHQPRVEAAYGQLDQDGNRGLWWNASDGDGWITSVVVDPGDGRAPIEVPPSYAQECTDSESGWPTSGRYSDNEIRWSVPGTYHGTVTVNTAGCDGLSEQSATTAFVADVRPGDVRAPTPPPEPSPSPDVEQSLPPVDQSPDPHPGDVPGNEQPA